MSENNLSAASIKLLNLREEMAELEEQKEKRKEPEKPDGAINYGKASEYGHLQSQYEEFIKRMDNQISEIQNQISEVEHYIKQIIPAKNIAVIVSGQDGAAKYNLAVTHVKNDEGDRIDLE